MLIGRLHPLNPSLLATTSSRRRSVVGWHEILLFVSNRRLTFERNRCHRACNAYRYLSVRRPIFFREKTRLPVIDRSFVFARSFDRFCVLLTQIHQGASFRGFLPCICKVVSVLVCCLG